MKADTFRVARMLRRIGIGPDGPLKSLNASLWSVFFAATGYHHKLPAWSIRHPWHDM